MKLTDEDARRLRGQLIMTYDHPVTAEMIAEAASNFDEKAAFEAEKSNLEIKLWDKKSDINGVPAQDVLAHRDDVEDDDEVYLIINRQTNSVIFFQPHEPNVEGKNKIKKSNWEKIAQKHMEEYAQGQVYGRFEDELVRKIKKA